MSIPRLIYIGGVKPHPCFIPLGALRTGIYHFGFLWLFSDVFGSLRKTSFYFWFFGKPQNSSPMR